MSCKSEFSITIMQEYFTTETTPGQFDLLLLLQFYVQLLFHLCRLTVRNDNKSNPFSFLVTSNLKFRGGGISHEELCELVVGLRIENTLGNYQH